ncbi:uncharacterized protein LOC134193382 [Corticium candelabrum]|uniref:uncharacterized protein LOC134193382 n=1 Tax=Corticium candelabrum TaxID=121492 RepID=UPI002E275635|nr:uncharacterized protein LOC134193382 [Corticium candelabrum]
MTIQKKGMFVSASISSSTFKVFTNKTNVTMSTKGLNLAVLTDTFPMAFSINEADLTIDKESTNVNWVCNISQANQSEKASTQASTAAPTASQNKTATKQESPAPTTPAKDGSTISMSSYIIYIAIAGAILVIVGYIAYHNRDYLCKLIGKGGQRRRPKKKNYKHLKSLKDAFP